MSLPVSAIFLFLLLPVVVSRCPDSWVPFGGSCYAYNRNAVTWADAQSICAHLNSHLVEIESAAENRFVFNRMKRVHASKTWLGFNDFVHEQKYVSATTHREITYSNWHPGEPNNKNGHQDCAAIHAQGTWDDANCNEDKLTFFCEQKANGRDGRSATAH